MTTTPSQDAMRAETQDEQRAAFRIKGDPSEPYHRGKRTHGGGGTRMYWRWRQMMTRCYNPKDSDYHRYGGRGIVVCERWHVFANYLQDVGEPSDWGMTLDRINNDGNYEPSNWRWATRAEQVRNTCKARLIELNGKMVNMADAARILGMNKSTLSRRISKGIPLDLPVRKRTTRITKGT